MKYFLTLSAALSLLPAAVRAGLEDAKYSTVLTPTNFDNVIASQTEGTLVAFFAPWCGHCKSLEPVWSRIAEAFDGDDRCKVAHLNADEPTARPISSKYGVSGFPTLKFLSPPSKGSQVDTYNGPRTEEAFLEYLNAKCGTEKGKGGILNELAGRIPSLDTLAKAYLFPTTVRSTLFHEAEKLVSDLSTSTAKQHRMKEYYLRLFKKWSEIAGDNVGEAKAWVEKESKRLAKLAQKKGQIQVEKLEEVKMKQNILAVFASAASSVSSLSATASSHVSSASTVLSSSAASVASQVSDSARAASATGASVVNDATKSAQSVAAKVTDRVKQEL
ncbi:hypothetical protein JCM11491_003175 [Sporobolomyces phaffii]